MIYCFDIDGTVCSLTKDSNYPSAIPFEDVRHAINKLYEEGHTILFMTARGSVSRKDWTAFTAEQLDEWGFKYHKLITNQKPHADIFIDDKCLNAVDWRSSLTPPKKGFIAGAFDLIHPGYIESFKETANHCGYLIVGLQVDPSRERQNKIKPVLTCEERRETLLALKYVDEVVIYETEEDLYELLTRLDIGVRFLGDDYIGKEYTGQELKHPIVFIPRNHGWSTTKIKKLIAEELR